jgi:hypothetical protein
VGTPRFKRKEVVKKDAARLLQCCNWKLTLQNVRVLRQKSWKARLDYRV